MRLRRAALLPLFCLALTSAAPPKAVLPMLPPGLWAASKDQAFHERWFGDQLRAMGEQPLWQPREMPGGVRVDRLLVLPTFAPAFAIRIERIGRTGVNVVVTMLNGRGGYSPGKPKRQELFFLTSLDLVQLESLTEQAQLDRMPLEQDAARDGKSEITVCADGTQFVFEHSGADGYRIVSRHECAVQEPIARLVKAWLDVAGIEADAKGGYRFR